jgi:putative DNA primase/helicase
MSDDPTDDADAFWNERWQEAAREYHKERRRGELTGRDRQKGTADDGSQPPPELTSDVIINLAGLTPLQYAQQLGREAKKYKTPARLIEKAVEAVRIEQEAEKLLEPHWEVIPADDPVDAVKLFAHIEARILHHVAMPKHLAFVVALWVGQSWLHENATYSPILFITSPERDSGKTTLVGIIGFMVRRSLLSVGISAAALYRSIEKWHPTFVIDEADEAFADNPDLRQVVNSGWTRGQGVVRCDPDSHEPRKFSTFCPKAIALKGRDAPDTILSRAIFITVKRRIKSEAIAHFGHVDDACFARLRSQLARWAGDNGKVLGLVRPTMPDGFLNRTASNWQLMFAIADSLGEEAGRRARAAAQQIVGITDLRSAGVALLQDIKTMFDRSTLDYVTSKAIIDDLTSDPEKPWAEWSRGKPITEKGVASLLHEYQISSRNVGPRGAQAKGYRKIDFKDAWERYLVPQEAPPSDSDVLPSTRALNCNDYAFVEKSAVHQDDGGREKDGHFSNNTNAVDGWTGNNPEIAPSANLNAVDDGIPDCLRRGPKVARPSALGPTGDSLDDLQ